MKLKVWLSEKAGMSYDEYKNLPEFERWKIEADFRAYNRGQQKRAAIAADSDTIFVRPMTQEELDLFTTQADKERSRYDESKRIGGIDGRNNYTALHHR